MFHVIIQSKYFHPDPSQVLPIIIVNIQYFPHFKYTIINLVYTKKSGFHKLISTLWGYGDKPELFSYNPY